MSTNQPTPAPSAQAQSGSIVTDRDHVKDLIDERYQQYDNGTKAWSFAYNTCLMGAAALSAASAVIVKVTFLTQQHATDTAAICSSLAALFSTLIAGGGFARKWRANRIARSKTSQLQIDVLNPAIQVDDLTKSLKQIIEEQDVGIVGPS